MQFQLIDLSGVVLALQSIEGVLWADARIETNRSKPNEIVGIVSGKRLEPAKIMQSLVSGFPKHCLPHKIIVVNEAANRKAA